MAIQLIPLPPRKRTKTEKLWYATPGHKCHWCGIDTKLAVGSSPSPDTGTRDHILPRHRGGSNDPSNIVLACYLCNNRRNYEDHYSLPEGHLLGKYKVPGWRDMTNGSGKYVCLTADEKKALFAPKPVLAPSQASPTVPPRVKVPVENVLREQRDQALAEVAYLRKELKQYEETVRSMQEEQKKLTVWRLIRQRIARFINPK